MSVARELVRQVYGDSRNMMTPNRLGYGMIAKYFRQGVLVYALAYELSKGTGIPRGDFGRGPDIWALTVVRVRAGQHGCETIKAMELSKCFHSRPDMCDWRNTLRRAGRLAARGLKAHSV